MSDTPITPIHQWTHAGTKVRILKCVTKDGKGYDGFQWPKRGWKAGDRVTVKAGKVVKHEKVCP